MTDNRNKSIIDSDSNSETESENSIVDDNDPTTDDDETTLEIRTVTTVKIERAKWIPSNKNIGVPDNAIVAGYDEDRATIYVGRAYHLGCFLPAKIIPSKQFASVLFDGQEYPKLDYEILCGDGIKWFTSSSSIPTEAFRIGKKGNVPIFIGRVHHNGSLLSGAVDNRSRELCLTINGILHSFSEFEILIEQKGATWFPSKTHEPLRNGAILGGYDADNFPMYVGRAFHLNCVIPAKFIPAKRKVFVAYAGKEVIKNDLDILCHNSIAWVPIDSNSPKIPPRAIVGGNTSSGVTLYIGRAFYKGKLTVGKVLPCGALYISYGGIEIGIHSAYKILVEQ